MAKQVVWTKQGLKKYGEIINWLQEETSAETVLKFDKKVKEHLLRLSHFPGLGRISKRHKAIRSIKVDKHRRAYYRISGNRLFVVYFFDTRQDSSKNLYG